MKCKVCGERYRAGEYSPRILPCSHTFCSTCIDKLIKQKKKTCPFCRQKYEAKSVSNLTINRDLLEVSEQHYNDFGALPISFPVWRESVWKRILGDVLSESSETKSLLKSVVSKNITFIRSHADDIEIYKKKIPNILKQVSERHKVLTKEIEEANMFVKETREFMEKEGLGNGDIYSIRAYIEITKRLLDEVGRKYLDIEQCPNVLDTIYDEAMLFFEISNAEIMNAEGKSEVQDEDDDSDGEQDDDDNDGEQDDDDNDGEQDDDDNDGEWDDDDNDGEENDDDSDGEENDDDSDDEDDIDDDDEGSVLPLVISVVDHMRMMDINPQAALANSPAAPWNPPAASGNPVPPTSRPRTSDAFRLYCWRCEQSLSKVPCFLASNDCANPHIYLCMKCLECWEKKGRIQLSSAKKHQPHRKPLTKGSFCFINTNYYLNQLEHFLERNEQWKNQFLTYNLTIKEDFKLRIDSVIELRNGIIKKLESRNEALKTILDDISKEEDMLKEKDAKLEAFSDFFSAAALMDTVQECVESFKSFVKEISASLTKEKSATDRLHKKRQKTNDAAIQLENNISSSLS